MSKTNSDRHALGPPFKLAICAGLGALALAGCGGGGDPSSALTETAQQRDSACGVRGSVVAFTSSRGPFATLPAGFLPGDNWEVWLMDDDFLNPGLPQQLTENFPPLEKPGTGGDTFAALTRKGQIVFDSNRDRDAAREAVNTSDLFLMNLDGSKQTKLTRGSSATWSPNGQRIAFHRSAQYDGTPSSTLVPIRGDPGAPAPDSDIFVAKLSDLLKGKAPTNLTRVEPRVHIHDDADWSPDGKTIVYTRHRVTDTVQTNLVTAEICMIDAKGKRSPVCILQNGEEERAPSWSPDGSKIAYMCRKGAATLPANPRFEICVINADGSGETRLTTDTFFDATPLWSPDGRKIMFSRTITGVGQQVWLMNAVDGSEQVALTTPPGINTATSWLEVCAGNAGHGKRAADD